MRVHAQRVRKVRGRLCATSPFRAPAEWLAGRGQVTCASGVTKSMLEQDLACIAGQAGDDDPDHTSMPFLRDHLPVTLRHEFSLISVSGHFWSKP